MIVVPSFSSPLAHQVTVDKSSQAVQANPNSAHNEVLKSGAIPVTDANAGQRANAGAKSSSPASNKPDESVVQDPEKKHSDDASDGKSSVTAKQDSDSKEGEDGKKSDSQLGGQAQLSEEELDQLRELKSRDREVRAHEQAHLAAAGGIATSGPTYEFQRGPDGRRYAVGGEVQIDSSKVPNDPEATIRKAQQIRRAALAPAEPSSQDRSVAAAATAMEQQARVEMSEAQRAERQQLEEERQARAEKLKGDDDDDKATTAGKSEQYCAVCGGAHSSQSHVDSNNSLISQTFGSVALASDAQEVQVDLLA